MRLLAKATLSRIAHRRYSAGRFAAEACRGQPHVAPCLAPQQFQRQGAARRGNGGRRRIDRSPPDIYGGSGTAPEVNRMGILRDFRLEIVG